MSGTSGVLSWVRVGAECICVSSWGGNTRWYLPKRGVIYVVGSVDAIHQDGPMLEIAGIGDARHGYKFPVKCLRPLTRKSLEADSTMFARLFKTERERV